MNSTELQNIVDQLETIFDKMVDDSNNLIKSSAVKIKTAILSAKDVIRQQQAIQSAVDDISKCYIADFHHDLEDGWYKIDYPDGTYKEFLYFSSFANEIPSGAAVFWKGPEHHMPKYSVEFDKTTKIWIKP